MEIYLKFYAQVNQNTAIQLQKIVEQGLLQGLQTLHLLISTPGGSVFDGISLYNFLKGLPITVNTYNFGSVDSIGVVVFCSGSNRYSVPNARFLLHPVSMQIVGNQVFDEPLLEERLNVMKADQTNIARVISFTINKPVDSVLKLIHNRTTFDPETALKNGLITEIKSGLVPAGAQLISIYDSQPQPPPIFQPYPNPRGITVEPYQSFSIIPNTFTKI